MAVFTGTEVIIWGGRNQRNSTPVTAAAARPGTQTALGDGALFDLATRQWRTLPPAPISPRWASATAWTGSEMLVIGGQTDVGGSGIVATTAGAAFDPVRNRWRTLPIAPVCANGWSAWTYTQFVVSGNCAGAPHRVAAFDPARNTWTELPAPRGAFDLIGVNGALYAWSGIDHGYRFDASRRRWLPLPARAEPSFGEETVAVDFAHTELAVIGPLSPTTGGVAIDVFDPEASTWSRVEVPAVGPVLGSAVAVAPDRLVWNEGRGYAWFVNGGHAGTVRRGPVSVDRVSETLLAIGNRKVFFWGGQSIPNGQSGVSQPSNDGGIVQLP